MGLNDLAAKVTDPYERKARLWPALLALLPLIVTVELQYAYILSVLSNVITLAAASGGLYLLTNLCRELGKNLEPRLYKEWGGKPTTQLLRHSNTTIEGVTKRRYHSFLSGKIKESFPDAAQETNNPTGADDVYQSAIRWLLNHTRDTKKFGILFSENIAYGFRRNTLALKPIGLTIVFVSLVWTLAAQGIITMSSPYLFNTSAVASLSDMSVISITISLVMLLVWVAFFTRRSVRTAAFTYAETLLRACDVLK